MDKTKKIKNTFDELPESDVVKALTKKALGYDTTEIIEEYSLDEDNNEKLVKKKITKKSVPPDITAVKVLIELQSLENSCDLKDLTDTELDEKIEQILKQIKEQENDNNS